MDRTCATRAAARSGIPDWYRAHLERRRARILRLRVLLAGLGALSDPLPVASAPLQVANKGGHKPRPSE